MELSRPNRSDIHLSKDEEAKIAEQTRDYFDGLAPSRHTKPQRSEYSSRYVDADTIPFPPEYVEFQRLEKENDHQKLVYNGAEVTEEFVETDYYKDLNCIDKQHHTTLDLRAKDFYRSCAGSGDKFFFSFFSVLCQTGTGFIKAESDGECYNIASDRATVHHAHTRGNPAANDWIPALADEVIQASQKPKRSDN
ncbi:hypothetical protein Dimus_020228 [Dionaea muscipula]